MESALVFVFQMKYGQITNCAVQMFCPHLKKVCWIQLSTLQRQKHASPVCCKCSYLTVLRVIFLRSFFFCFFFFALKKDIGNVNVEFFHFVFFFFKNVCTMISPEDCVYRLWIRRENRSIPAQSCLDVLCCPCAVPDKMIFREKVLDLISF